MDRSFLLANLRLSYLGRLPLLLVQGFLLFVVYQLNAPATAESDIQTQFRFESSGEAIINQNAVATALEVGPGAMTSLVLLVVTGLLLSPNNPFASQNRRTGLLQTLKNCSYSPQQIVLTRFGIHWLHASSYLLVGCSIMGWSLVQRGAVDSGEAMGLVAGIGGQLIFMVLPIMIGLSYLLRILFRAYDFCSGNGLIKMLILFGFVSLLSLTLPELSRWAQVQENLLLPAVPISYLGDKTYLPFYLRSFSFDLLAIALAATAAALILCARVFEEME